MIYPLGRSLFFAIVSMGALICVFTVQKSVKRWIEITFRRRYPFQTWVCPGWFFCVFFWLSLHPSSILSSRSERLQCEYIGWCFSVTSWDIVLRQYSSLLIIETGLIDLNTNLLQLSQLRLYFSLFFIKTFIRIFNSLRTYRRGVW